MKRRRFVLTFLVLGLAAACGTSEPRPEPAGSLGVVSQGAVDRAVAGLCDLVETADLTEAVPVFYDRSHQMLHVIAAATQEVDRGAAADLLETKQVVEADLAGAALPGGFTDDVEALIAATRVAIGSLGLEALECGA